MNIREKTDEWLQLKKAHDELGLIEERYPAIFHNAAVGIDLLSAEGHFLQANPTLQDMLGYTEEELKGLSIVDITFPEDRQISQEKLDALTKGTINSYRIENRYVTKDGSLLWADISMSAIRDSDGHHTATIGVISDITERKDAEEALRESEERFRNFLNATDDLAFIKDQHFRYVFVNKANQDFFGLSEQDIIGKTDFELMPQDVAGDCLETDQRVITENDIVIAEESSAERIFEIRKFPVKLACQEVGVGAFLRDITHRKRVEEALKDSEERQRSLVDHLPQRIFIKDRNSIYLSCNKNYASDLGIASDQIVDKDDFAFYPPELAQAYRADDQACMATGMVKAIDEEPYKVDGQELWTHTTKVPFRDTQGRIIGVLGIFEDITARKQLEAERLEMERTLLHAQKLKSLSVMAGRISHDFSNQLAVILGNLELALRGLPTDSKTKASVINAIEAANNSVELSHQMLIYTGSAFYLPQDIDVNELLKRTSDLLESSVPKHVNLKLEIGNTLPPIKGDADQIQRLVTNILDNALEAIGNMKGSIRLSTGVTDCDEAYLSHNRLEMKTEPGRFVFLEITDTGCGMDTETLHKVFDPFFTTKSNNRGLGMSEVMGIVKGHHGVLFVVSQLGKGTTIQVLFPVSKETQASSLADRESVETKSSAPGVPSLRKTILLVDDEEGVLDFTVQHLNLLGYDTITASDGEQGVRIFRERLHEIDLVILDFAMPRMNGVEAFEELIRIKPDVKVILCSGYTEDVVMKSFAHQHSAAVLHKPYNMEDLKGELERLLGSGS